MSNSSTHNSCALLMFLPRAYSPAHMCLEHTAVIGYVIGGTPRVLHCCLSPMRPAPFQTPQPHSCTSDVTCASRDAVLPLLFLIPDDLLVQPLAKLKVQGDRSHWHRGRAESQAQHDSTPRVYITGQLRRSMLCNDDDDITGSATQC
jgi:hypothetical protein